MGSPEKKVYPLVMNLGCPHFKLEFYHWASKTDHQKCHRAFTLAQDLQFLEQIRIRQPQILSRSKIQSEQFVTKIQQLYASFNCTFIHQNVS